MALSALGRIEIGDDVWIAYNVSVLGNVKIGEGAVRVNGEVVAEGRGSAGIRGLDEGRRLVRDREFRLDGARGGEGLNVENVLVIDRPVHATVPFTRETPP